MSQTMNPADCRYFAESLMLPEQYDLLASAWARGVAGNTGWLSYQYGLLGNLNGPGDLSGYAFVSAGTYTVTAYAVGSQTVTFDGTNVIAASAGMGSISWDGTTGWYPITTDAGAGEYASLWLRRV